MSRRAWCRESGPPRSREAFGSNPWPPTKRNLQILSHGQCRPRMRASGKRLALQCSRSVLFKAGAEDQGPPNPPAGLGPKPSGANRVQSPSGSFNACWRREPGCGDTDRPVADRLRGSAKNADREKLNDERGVKPLPVNGSRDGAESGKAERDR